MKRIVSMIILGHWLLFFLLHAMGALAGTLAFARFAFPPLAASGAAMNAMPLVSAGLGLASLLAATLFLWALLAVAFSGSGDDQSGEVASFAFGSAVLVFSALSAVAIVQAEPSVLVAATVYFSALVLSWIAVRAPLPLQSIAEPRTDISVDAARFMAGDAAFQNQLPGRGQG